MLPSLSTTEVHESWLHVGMAHMCSPSWARTELDKLWPISRLDNWLTGHQYHHKHPWWGSGTTFGNFFSVEPEEEKVLLLCSNALCCLVFDFQVPLFLLSVRQGGRYWSAKRTTGGFSWPEDKWRREIGGWSYQGTRSSTGWGKGQSWMVLRM